MPPILGKLTLITPLGNPSEVPGSGEYMALDDVRALLAHKVMTQVNPSPEASAAMTTCLDALWPTWRDVQKVMREQADHFLKAPR